MGSQLLTSSKLLLISICSWYGIEEELEDINTSLEFILEERGDLFLISFISTSEGKWVIKGRTLFAKECENYIFSTSLTGATTQDRDKRERSMD